MAHAISESRYFSGSLADRLRYTAEHPVRGRKLDHDLMLEAAAALEGIAGIVGGIKSESSRQQTNYNTSDFAPNKSDDSRSQYAECGRINGVQHQSFVS